MCYLFVAHIICATCAIYCYAMNHFTSIPMHVICVLHVLCAIYFPCVSYELYVLFVIVVCALCLPCILCVALTIYFI